MKPLTQEIIELYSLKDFVGDNTPTVSVTIDGINMYNVSSLSVTREQGIIAQSFSISLINVNHSNWTDTGYFNQVRNDEAHGKPQNSYYNLIQPGKEVVITVGYGANTNTIFTGIIDTVTTKIGRDCIIEITGRDIGKYLIDSTILCEDTTSGSEILYEITYPIDIGITEVYLTDTDLNPYLYEIFIDACMRAGINETDISVGTSPVTDFPLRLDDLNGEYFEEFTGTWDSLCQQIAKLLVANIDVDESGTIILSKIVQPDPDAWKGITLNGTDWTSIGIDIFYKDRAVESSLVVQNVTKTTTYVKDIDWVYDETTNSIRRTSDSTIGSGDSVWVYEKYVNWIFKNGINIFDLNQFVSHDDCYGTIVAKNEDEDLIRSINIGSYGDGSIVNSNKIHVEDLPELITENQLDNWLQDKKKEMMSKYWQVDANVLPITQLQVNDLVQFLIYGTIGGIYKITGFSWTWDADDGHSCNVHGIFVCNP